MHIAVIGAGGVGGYLGGRLAQAGLDVAFVARGPHLKAIRQNGLQVFSPRGDFMIHPARATEDPADVGPVDLVLFCVKAYDAVRAAAQLMPMVGAQTVIIPVLNGIDHIGQLQAAVGPEHVLGGTAAVGSNIASPGVIRHWGGEWLAFGELAGGSSERCVEICEKLAASGCEIETVADIGYQMWRKFAILAGMGVCSAVRAGTAIVRRTPETFELLRQAMTEAAAVARAKSVPLTESIVDVMVEQAPAGNFKPSMLVDLERGKRLELEALNGAVSRLGKQLGVPTPANDFIYACLKPYVNGTPRADPG